MDVDFTYISSSPTLSTRDCNIQCVHCENVCRYLHPASASSSVLEFSAALFPLMTTDFALRERPIAHNRKLFPAVVQSSRPCVDAIRRLENNYSVATLPSITPGESWFREIPSKRAILTPSSPGNSEDIRGRAASSAGHLAARDGLVPVYRVERRAAVGQQEILRQCPL